MPSQPQPDDKLSGYPWREIVINCHRCNRHAQVGRDILLKAYGDLTMEELARRIAADRSCAHATGDNYCAARMLTPGVETWACLEEAMHGGWVAMLHCNRNMEAMKRGSACRKPFELYVPTLVALLGWDFPLERLPHKLTCPGCGTRSFFIEWFVPEPAGEPREALAGKGAV